MNDLMRKTMGDMNDQTLTKQTFYGDGYEPTYTPLMAMATNGTAENEYQTDYCESQTFAKSIGHENPNYEYNDDTAHCDDFDQTLFENDLLQHNIKTEDSDPCESQIPPNQEFISKLDELFDDSPQQAYIESMLAYLEGKEGLLTWYRSILICRLRGPSDNSLFGNAPVTRKNTNKSTSAYKYAKDCYNLSLYLNGDMTAQIEEIFSTRSTKPIRTDSTSKNTEQTPSSVDTACTKQLIQSLRLELNEAKKSHSESLKGMQSKIDSLDEKTDL